MWMLGAGEKKRGGLGLRMWCGMLGEREIKKREGRKMEGVVWMLGAGKMKREGRRVEDVVRDAEREGDEEGRRVEGVVWMLGGVEKKRGGLGLR